MQDAVINLCRVKMRDQQRLDSVGYLEEYPQYPHEMDAFKDKVMPRGGNAGGGGQPGWILKCKGWETDPNAYIYFTVQGHAWEPICDALGKPEWNADDFRVAAGGGADERGAPVVIGQIHVGPVFEEDFGGVLVVALGGL